MKFMTVYYTRNVTKTNISKRNLCRGLNTAYMLCPKRVTKFIA